MFHDSLILEVYYPIHNIWPMVSLSSEVYPVPIFPLYFSKIRFELTEDCPLLIPDKNFVRIYEFTNSWFFMAIQILYR